LQDRQVVEELDIRVDSRYQRLAASHAVRNVWDVLVELITNSDDSYGRLGQPTQILIEVEHSHSEKRFVRVADRAEGMLPDELKAKLTWSGSGSYEGESRGFMGRGAKDIVAIGDCLFETIKDGAYSSILLKRGMKAEIHKPRKATDADRERLGVGKKNGTVATVWPGDAQLPRHSTLLELLPQHFAIREIFRREGTKARLVDLTAGDKDTLQFKRPEVRLVYRDEFEVDADLFPGVWTSLEVYRDYV